MDRKRLIAIAAAGFLVLAAIGLWLAGRSDSARPPAARPAAGAPPVAAADDATPLTFRIENQHVEASLTLPPSVKATPALHQALYDDGARDLQRFADGAVADRTEMEGEGLNPRPYAKQIEWSPAGSTGKLISLRATVYEDTGGAHPNGSFDARIWDKAMNRQVRPKTLFGRTDLPRLDAALCDAIKKAKKERTGETWTPDDTWTCPRLADTAFVLLDGESGRAGGLLVLLPPYLVGPYVEGGYEIALPSAVVKPFVAPAYADEFGD